MLNSIFDKEVQNQPIYYTSENNWTISCESTGPYLSNDRTLHPASSLKRKPGARMQMLYDR